MLLYTVLLYVHVYICIRYVFSNNFYDLGGGGVWGLVGLLYIIILVFDKPLCCVPLHYTCMYIVNELNVHVHE